MEGKEAPGNEKDKNSNAGDIKKLKKIIKFPLKIKLIAIGVLLSFFILITYLVIFTVLVDQGFLDVDDNSAYAMGSPYYANSNSYWWPIGSTETTTENGVLFAVFSGSRDWAVSTKGSAIKTFGDYRDSIVGTIKSELSDGNYFDAFAGYADKCDEMLAYESEHGSAYVASQQKDASDYIIAVVISVVVGIIIGFIGSGIMKSKLKSVNYKSGATDYIVPESFKLDNSRDVYLYNTITRTERESESSSSSDGGSHTSSSGSSHGGGSGKF